MIINFMLAIFAFTMFVLATYLLADSIGSAIYKSIKFLTKEEENENE